MNADLARLASPQNDPGDYYEHRDIAARLALAAVPIGEENAAPSSVIHTDAGLLGLVDEGQTRATLENWCAVTRKYRSRLGPDGTVLYWQNPSRIDWQSPWTRIES